jgi:predicted nucleic acid-binding Zn ribbon protein
MSDAPLRKCPECGKSKLQRLVSAPQFRLKGSGWYETDFKGDSEKKRNLVEKGSEDSAASAKSDSGTDAVAKEAAPAAETPKPASPKPETAKRAAAKKKAAPKARAAKSSRK